MLKLEKKSRRMGSLRNVVVNTVWYVNMLIESFESKLGQNFKIKGENNCNSEMIVYLVNCKCCQKQYVGSTSTRFRLTFNNYKSCHIKDSLNKSVPQESFHAHFKEQSHNGMNDWQCTIIDKAENLEQLRRREAFWLNERNVAFW